MYEEILRLVRYRLRPGAALYARKFRLSCSEMNGRYSSNEFIVEVLLCECLGLLLGSPLPSLVGMGLGTALDTPRAVGKGVCSSGFGTSDPLFAQVNVLHSVNRVAHPSHVLNSQQFLHRGHQPPPEMAGHSLASSHRNSSKWGCRGRGQRGFVSGSPLGALLRYRLL